MTLYDPAHRQTWDLIPWIVNQSASTIERELAEIHLQFCADCREELVFQTRVQAGMSDAPVAVDCDAKPSLERLFKRIDAEDAAFPGASIDFSGQASFESAQQRSTHTGFWRFRLSRALAAAVVLQAFGLIALGALLIERDRASPVAEGYTTLSRFEPSTAAATIRLVPSPTLTVGALQSVLDDADLQIVGSNPGGTILALGPAIASAASASVESMDVRNHQIAATLNRLRAQPGVLLAEPILAADAGH